MEEIGRKFGVDVVAKGTGGIGSILDPETIKGFIIRVRKGTPPSKVIAVPDMKGMIDEPGTLRHLRVIFSKVKKDVQKEYSCDLCCVPLERDLEDFVESCLPANRKANYTKQIIREGKFTAAKKFASYMDKDLIKKTSPMLVETIFCRACPGL